MAGHRLRRKTARAFGASTGQGQRAARIIVYFHGGGWIVGSPLTHADISGALSAATGLEVVSVDYRLAPEYPAPAPIEDGLAAIDHVLARDRGTSLILCGDSAGAAIALAVASAAPLQRSRRASPALPPAMAATAFSTANPLSSLARARAGSMRRVLPACGRPRMGQSGEPLWQ